MLAEVGGIAEATQINTQPTWAERVYGPRLASAEHFRVAEAAFGKFADVNAELSPKILDGSIDQDTAQHYVGRLARLELGIREFCRSADVDPKKAALDILIGRREKYIAEWDGATARVEAAGDEPTVANIKRECRASWGKWQFTVYGKERNILADGRRAYEERILAGDSPEEARASVKQGLLAQGHTLERTYKTVGGLRTFDLTQYFDVTPDLEGIVASSKEFEALTGQGVEDSMRQLGDEMGEVVELRSFFDIEAGESIADPATINLKFETIEAFHAHISEQSDAGQISEGERNRYLGITSLEELSKYVREHLAYECIDVVVAAGGILHRIPADVPAAMADAEQDRDKYTKVVAVIKEQLPDITVTPRIAERAVKTTEVLAAEGEFDPYIPIAVGLLGNQLRFGALDPLL